MLGLWQGVLLNLQKFNPIKPGPRPFPRYDAEGMADDGSGSPAHYPPQLKAISGRTTASSELRSMLDLGVHVVVRPAGGPPKSNVIAEANAKCLSEYPVAAPVAKQINLSIQVNVQLGTSRCRYYLHGLVFDSNWKLVGDLVLEYEFETNQQGQIDVSLNGNAVKTIPNNSVFKDTQPSGAFGLAAGMSYLEFKVALLGFPEMCDVNAVGNIKLV